MTSYAGSTSFKYIKFVTSPTGICDLVLMVNSNLDHILHVSQLSDLLIKNRPWEIFPVSFNAIARDDPLRIC